MIPLSINITPTAQQFVLPADLAEIVYALISEQALFGDSTLRGEANGGVVYLPARSTTVLVAPEGRFPLVEESTGPVEADSVESETNEIAEAAPALLEETVEVEIEVAAAVCGRSGLLWLLALVSVAHGAGAFVFYRGGKRSKVIDPDG